MKKLGTKSLCRLFLVIILQIFIINLSWLHAIEVEPGGEYEFTYSTTTSFCPSSVSISYTGEGEEYFSQKGFAWLSCFQVGDEYLSGATFTFAVSEGTPNEIYEGEFIIEFRSTSSSKTITKEVVWEVGGAALKAKFSANPLSGVAPLYVKFTDESRGEISSWFWEFGDGGTSNEADPIHTYTEKGYYTVSLTVTDSAGSDILVKENYIKVAPNIADFDAAPLKGVLPLTVEFSDLSTGSVSSWIWDFGDGNTSDTQNPTNTYMNAGTYDVSLIISGDYGSDTIVKEDLIEVYAVEADFSGNPTRGLVPFNVGFTDESQGDVESWLWDFGDGNTSDEQNPVHTYTLVGDFTVSLTVTNQEGSDRIEKEDLVEVSSIMGNGNIVSSSVYDARSVIASDLTGDGLHDILYVSSNSHKVAWNENLGNGIFDIQHDLASFSYKPESISIADLDGDGDQDVLVASSEDHHISWYKNLGNGLFGAKSIIASFGDPESVCAADLDGDDDLDIIAAAGIVNEVAWFENLGNAKFSDKQVLAGGFGLADVHCADLDLDGNQDVVFLRDEMSYGTIGWCKNNGDGSFEQWSTICTDAYDAKSIYVADLDNDNYMDILFASYDYNKIGWYKNLHNGTFGEQQIVTTMAEGAGFVFASDLDNDQDMDILSASWGDDKVAWYKNDGEGSFSEQLVITESANGASSVFSTDLDGDGDEDVLSTSLYDNKIAWYENLGNSTFGQQQVLSTSSIGPVVGPVMVISDDLDGDGDSDVLSISIYDHKVAWYENLDNGLFGKEQVIAAPANNPGSVYAADLDNDGDQDVLSASFLDNKIAWYENLGENNFGTQKIITTSALSAWSVFAADLDNDGDQDVLSATILGNSKIAWHENLGDGSFSDQRIITTFVNDAWSVFAADLDNDGDQDVLSASSLDNKIAWYENMGDGSFSDQRIITTEAEDARAVFACDLNNDGDVDVLSASSADNKIAWYKNMGDGSFGDSRIITTEAKSARAVFACDLDNDGDLDVLSASSYDDKIAWYENLGQESFGDQQIISDTAKYASSVNAADIDDDGDIDILAATTNEVVWYENQLKLQSAFEASQVTGTVPFEVDFYTIPYGRPDAWFWDFGDGSVSEEQNPTHVYTSDGVFSVSLTVEDAEESDSYTITDYISVVIAKPEADFFADQTTGGYPLKVQFTDNSENHVSIWLWDFGDGSTSDEQNPVHTYELPGVYTVKLRVTGDGGTDIRTRTNYIHVTSPASINTRSDQSVFRLFPNPATDILNVVLKETEWEVDASISIVNLNGQLIKRKEISGGSGKRHTLDLSGIPSGLYSVVLESCRGRTVQRMVLIR